MASVFKFWFFCSDVCMLFHFKEIQWPYWSSLSVCLLVHALLVCVAGILKGRKRVRQKEGNIHLSSSLPSRALYLLARPLSNRAPQSPLFAIAKQMCVNILLENYKYKNSKALRILNINKTRRIRHLF